MSVETPGHNPRTIMQTPALTPEQRKRARLNRRSGSVAPRGVFDSFTRALVRACGKRPPSSKAKRRALIKKAGGVRALFEQQAGIL